MTERLGPSDSEPSASVGSPESGDWSFAERRAFGLRADALAAALSGIQLNRATVTFDADEDDAVEETKLSWRVTATKLPVPIPMMIVVADLRATCRGWFVGATAFGTIDFRDEADLPSDDDQEAHNSIAAWASAPLWDYASGFARMLAAGPSACNVDIPYPTPEAEFGALRADVEAERVNGADEPASAT